MNSNEYQNHDEPSFDEYTCRVCGYANESQRAFLKEPDLCNKCASYPITEFTIQDVKTNLRQQIETAEERLNAHKVMLAHVESGAMGADSVTNIDEYESLFRVYPTILSFYADSKKHAHPHFKKWQAEHDETGIPFDQFCVHEGILYIDEDCDSVVYKRLPGCRPK